MAIEEKGQKVRMRSALLTGLVALFPLALTLFVLGFIWKIIGAVSVPLGGLVKSIVRWTTGYEELPEYAGTAAAVLLLVILVYLLGFAVAGIFGRRILGWGESLLLRFPVINSIYPHAKQLSDFLFGERKIKFNRVVAIEYPRKGLHSIGFVTSEGIDSLSRRQGRKMIAVFVPTSPTPFTGWTVLVDEDEVIPVNISVDEAVRFTVSCGVLLPGHLPSESLGEPPQVSLPTADPPDAEDDTPPTPDVPES